jgi:hypothetical protein
MFDPATSGVKYIYHVLQIKKIALVHRVLMCFVRIMVATNINYFMKAEQQPSKTQLYKNKLTNYMFRPSRGHLQADISNIL